jgi:hypothetical protein
MKVAQHEVLGWRSEKPTRPGWDDRRAFTLGNPDPIDQGLNVSIVPAGTDILFCLISQSAAADTGLLSLNPFVTTSAHPRLREPATRMTNEQPRNTYMSSCFLYRPASLSRLFY